VLQVTPPSPIGRAKSVTELFAQHRLELRTVKNVTFSLFTSFFTQVFTLWLRTPLKENAMPESNPQKQRPENYQNGRERPHFFGFQPPKKVRGVAPALVNTTRQLHCRVHRRPYGRVVTRT
jgi:hypothetical protein